MPCERVTLPGGFSAIVCSSGRRKSPPCACGKASTRLCDWKVGEGKTCDVPLCSTCSTKPEPDKDLCPTHRETWRAWLKRKGEG